MVYTVCGEKFTHDQARVSSICTQLGIDIGPGRNISSARGEPAGNEFALSVASYTKERGVTAELQQQNIKKLIITVIVKPSFLMGGD